MVKGGSRGDWGSAGGTRTPRLRVGHGRPSKKGGARSQESRVYLWVGEGTGNMRSPVAGSTAGLADGQLQGARRESGVPPPTNHPKGGPHQTLFVVSRIGLLGRLDS